MFWIVSWLPGKGDQNGIKRSAFRSILLLEDSGIPSISSNLFVSAQFNVDRGFLGAGTEIMLGTAFY